MKLKLKILRQKFLDKFFLGLNVKTFITWKIRGII